MSLISRRTALLAAAASSIPAFAQQAPWPDHSLRIIVPQTAGGPSDILGRLFAQKLGEQLKQPVIVENRPGAGGNIGTDVVAKSKPDGYTLLINIAGILAINQTLYKQLPYNAGHDLASVARVVSSQLILVAHPSFPPNNVKELVDYAKTQPPGFIAYGSAGTGSPQHIGGELINMNAGIKLNHTPYKGAVPALQDLLGGQIPLAIVGLPATIPYIRSGKLKGIAVFSGSRSAALGAVPTFVESGYPDIEMDLAYSIYVAKATPQPLITRLNEELGAILKMPDVREKMTANDFEITFSSPADADAYLKSQIEKWRPIVHASGASTD
ncbi:MAG: tripartite tricarboxylate transporter substrate binding protein [Pseudomonadota bacterium]